MSPGKKRKGAARRGAPTGAHTQAVSFFETALNGGQLSGPEDEAELLESLADEYYLTDSLAQAAVSRRRALRLRQESGSVVGVAENHHRLSMYASHSGDLREAEHHAAQAVSVLERNCTDDDGPPVALGHAIVTQAYLALLGAHLDRAAGLLQRAGGIVAEAGDHTLAVRVDLIAGYCSGLAGRSEARAAMRAGVALAAELLEDEVFSQGATSLAFLDIEYRRFAEAAALLDNSIQQSMERELSLGTSWLLAMRSRLELLRGRWTDALSDAEQVLDGPHTPLASTLVLVVRALITLRRVGRPERGIDDAWRLLSPFGEHLRMFTSAAIAEQAWLTGIPDARIAGIRSVLAEFSAVNLPMMTGEVAVWLHRLGIEVEQDRVNGPYRHVLNGRAADAAEDFDRLGMPYEAALALTDSGEPDLVSRGLDTLDRLGAQAAANRVRQSLRAAGVTVVPARRRTTTLQNPVGLTARQIDVLQLLAIGLTYAEIAGRLHLSVKTVESHVSAVLTKLGAHNRREAVHRARDLRILLDRPVI